MIVSELSAQLAAEHRRVLLAEADVYRSAVHAGRVRRSSRTRDQLAALVRRPSLVRIRPIRRTDTGVISDGFSRLSAESRRMRFLSPKNALSAAELRYFTDVDHHDHEALVALTRLGGRGVGVARYVRNRDDPGTADVAVTVVDEWQGRGLGSELVARLVARARCEGVRRFTALMSVDNARARRLLQKAGGTVTPVERAGDTVTYEVTLAAPAAARQPSWWRLLGTSPAGCEGA